MKKIGLFGHFGNGHVFLDGQTVKTQNVTDTLKKRFGETAVETVDSYGGLSKLPGITIKLFKLFRKCGCVIIMPASRGLLYVAPLCYIYNKFFKRKLFYIVIGGWLDKFVNKHKFIGRILRKYDAIYVETTTLEKLLIKNDFRNIRVMPNFKDLSTISKDECKPYQDTPYRVCTFSRVMEQKGIGDAVRAVEKINSDANRTVVELDIYGSIDKAYEEDFKELINKSTDCVQYKGAVSPDSSVNILKNYFLLLFPTKFFTEGIPGTIIDGYAAGIPVISSRWESYYDIVEEEKTGLGYEINNCSELTELLKLAVDNPEKINNMKLRCIEKAEEFMPEEAIKVLVDDILM